MGCLHLQPDGPAPTTQLIPLCLGHAAAPNPADVPHFVSLGEATAAVARGVQRCQALLARLDPAGALAQR